MLELSTQYSFALLMKNAFKYSLTLCLLFFCSYAHLSAFVFVKTSYATSEKKSEINSSKDFSFLSVTEQFTSSSPLQKRTNVKEVLNDTDEEEVENITLKKTTEKRDFSISVYNQPITTFCTYFSKTSVGFQAIFKHLPSYNSSLYILFEVFRI